MSKSFARICSGRSGMTIALPGLLSAGSPARTSTPFSRAKLSCAQWCLPAPVYSVSCTTTVASLGRSRASETAAVIAVLPDGPRSRPSSLLIASVT